MCVWSATAGAQEVRACGVFDLNHTCPPFVAAMNVCGAILGRRPPNPNNTIWQYQQTSPAYPRPQFLQPPLTQRSESMHFSHTTGKFCTRLAATLPPLPDVHTLARCLPSPAHLLLRLLRLAAAAVVLIVNLLPTCARSILCRRQC